VKLTPIHFVVFAYSDHLLALTDDTSKDQMIMPIIN